MEDRLVLSANPLNAIDIVTVETMTQSTHDTVITSTASPSGGELEALLKLLNPTTGNDTYGKMTGLDEVKDLYGLDGSGQTVVVIDSGIAYSHLDLGGGFGDGYRVIGGYDFAGGDYDPYDSGPRGSHGTHVAGIIGADGQYSGVATGVDLVSLRIFNDDGTSNMQYLIDALEWVHENKDAFENPITTINLSVGYLDDSAGYFSQINEWFRILNEDGIFISVAAGNSFESVSDKSQLSYPAMSEYVVSVGSVGISGDVSYFSQRSANTIMAPGQYVKSTVPDYIGNGNGVDDDYSIFSGTSMAAPYVAGASTLIRQAMQIVGMTDITQQMIYDVIVATADSIYDAVTGMSYSRLNIKNAIESILPADSLGSSIADATGLGTVVDTTDIEGFFNTKTDKDYFSFVAGRDGTIVITPEMSAGLNGTWDVSGTPGATVADDGTVTIAVTAGTTYTLGFTATGTIGTYTLNARYTDAAKDDTPLDDKTDPGKDTIPGKDTVPGDDVDPGKDTVPGGDTTPADDTDHGSDTVPGGDTAPANDTDHGGDTVPGGDTDPGQQFDDEDEQQTDSVPLTVDQATLDNQRLTEGGKWYAITATNTGTMTFEALLPDGSARNLIIEMGDADGNVTAVYSGQSRIDFNMTAGTTAWVRVRTESGAGTIDGAAIRLTNLVRQVGTQIIVIGTDGNDDISFAAGTTHCLVINGVEYRFDAAAVANVSIDARGGSDTVHLTGTAGNETVTIDGTDANMTGKGYGIVVRNANQLDIDGNGGNDTFRYYDTVGDDQVTVRTGEITVASDRFFAKVAGASKFFAYANRGGNDSAVLYDSPENDTLNVSSNYALFKSGGTTSQLYSFKSLIAHSTGGGNDTATLTDTAGESLFAGSWESMKRHSDNQYVEVRGFTQVNLTSVFGGKSSVRLEDSTGDDTLTMSSNGVSLNGERYGISVRGFDDVHTSAVNGGNDKIMIYDTQKAQKLTAANNMISLIDSLHTWEADGFAEVWAFGSAMQSSKIENTGTDYVLNLLGQWEED